MEGKSEHEDEEGEGAGGQSLKNDCKNGDRRAAFTRLHNKAVTSQETL